MQVQFNTVQIWLNVDGVRWTLNEHVIQGTPPVSSIQNHTRIVDANGSGSRDILWGDASDYKYIDLEGGVVPGILTHVDNGLGKTTEIEYKSSTELMLADVAAGRTWQSHTPNPVRVVTRMTERDNLGAVKPPGGNYVNEYSYRDPVYEGRQREFRGFHTAGTRKVGDANSPTMVVRSTFLLGECVDENQIAGVSPCSAPERWRDNPREALKGRAVLSETFAEATTGSNANFLDRAGVFSESVHLTYRLRRLYVGLDGREVRQAFVSTSDRYSYDIASFDARNFGTNSMTDVERELGPGLVEADTSSTVTIRTLKGTARLQSASQVDFFGNVTDAIDRGCVNGCPAADEVITSHSTPGRPADDLSGWLWRTIDSYVSGRDGAKRHRGLLGYDGHGNLTSSQAELSGTLPLDRFHESVDAGIAPTPAAASGSGVIQLLTQSVDTFGNVKQRVGANGRCDSTEYDAAYQMLPVSNTIYAGPLNTGSGVTGGCGSVALTTTAEYDLGLAVATRIMGLHGELTTAVYDGLGRPIRITKPDPAVVGGVSSLATMKVEYVVTPDSAKQPYSLVHTQVQDGATAYVDSYSDTWLWIDGLGRVVVQMSPADTGAGDEGEWIVSGFRDYDAMGRVQRAYEPWFVDGDPQALDLAVPASVSYRRARYDAFGHRVQSFNLDGAVSAQLVSHALSTDVWDAADLNPGPHQGTPASQRRDGHGRVVSAVERMHGANGQIEEHYTLTTYLPSGEVTSITRQLGATGPQVTRWMQYDSLGRMVLNVDPNTSSGYVPGPGGDLSGLHAWRYAYDDAGDLVGTSDARGCGSNFFYDAGGRIIGEDFSPCLGAQPGYSAPEFGTGVGLEAAYVYDAPDPDSNAVMTADAGAAVDLNLLRGRLVSTADRGSKVLLQYDARGRVTGIAKRIAKPGPPVDDPAVRYAPRWYTGSVQYDALDRVITSSSGARVSEVLGAGGLSTVSTAYSKRGTVSRVDSSYGALVIGIQRGADGLVRQVTYGDVAQTTATLTFDARKRLSSARTSRQTPAVWLNPPSGYTPPGADTDQLVLENSVFTYDEVDNPVSIRDWRDEAEWPAGAKPVHRTMQYDDLYRVTSVASEYVGVGATADIWVSPDAPEEVSSNGGADDRRRPSPSPRISFDGRGQYQSFAYDWLGNTQASDDDAHGFYDRSLGKITNGSAVNGPYQLRAAANASDSLRAGALSATYDPAGNLTSMAVARGGPCLPSGAMCSQRYVYDWDEVGRLMRARRWDLAMAGVAADPVPTMSPTADLRYAYNLKNGRVVKTAEDGESNQRNTLYVCGALELRGAAWVENPNSPELSDYEHTAATEVPYLSSHGVRLARVAFDAAAPSADGNATHVFLEIQDYLGSTSSVIDRASGELVERTTYQAYGGTESDYRPRRWGEVREDYRFTGKEEDSEVGLMYFGARYYAPGLGRWLSPDPLAVHTMGADLNLYAYVHGRVFAAVDVAGLVDDAIKDPSSSECTGDMCSVGPCGGADSSGMSCWTASDDAGASSTPQVLATTLTPMMAATLGAGGGFAQSNSDKNGGFEGMAGYSGADTGSYFPEGALLVCSVAAGAAVLSSVVVEAAVATSTAEVAGSGAAATSGALYANGGATTAAVAATGVYAMQHPELLSEVQTAAQDVQAEAPELAAGARSIAQPLLQSMPTLQEVADYTTANPKVAEQNFLQTAADMIRGQMVRNPSDAAGYLSDAEQSAGRWANAINAGKVMQRVMDGFLERTGGFQQLGGPNQADWKSLNTGTLYDLTTYMGQAGHYARAYGSQLTLIMYDSVPKSWP